MRLHWWRCQKQLLHDYVGLYGMPIEHPLDHLDRFDHFCETVKINGISKDAFKLRIIPLSLADKEHQWEKYMLHNTITSGDQCKKVFLVKLFSTRRTTRLSNEISKLIKKGIRAFAMYANSSRGTFHNALTTISPRSLLSTLYREVLPNIECSSKP